MSINERKRQQRIRREREMTRRRTTILSNRDRDRFLKMLEDKEPNEALKKAAKRYKEKREKGEFVD
jgi:uncharacterized protein (DUF1778 family)